MITRAWRAAVPLVALHAAAWTMLWYVDGFGSFGRLDVFALEMLIALSAAALLVVACAPERWRRCARLLPLHPLALAFLGMMIDAQGRGGSEYLAHDWPEVAGLVGVLAGVGLEVLRHETGAAGVLHRLPWATVTPVAVGAAIEQPRLIGWLVSWIDRPPSSDWLVHAAIGGSAGVAIDALRMLAARTAPWTAASRDAR